VISTVITKSTGKAKSKIRENHQPLKKAKKRPETDIDKANIIVPIFSPSDF